MAECLCESGGSDMKAAIMKKRAARAMKNMCRRRKTRTEEIMVCSCRRRKTRTEEIMQEAPTEEDVGPMTLRNESETIDFPDDFSEFSEEEKMEFVKIQSPELIPLMEDHNKKQEAPTEEDVDPMTLRNESETIDFPDDFSEFSEEEKMEFVKTQSPELIPLMEDHNKKLIEYRDKWMPIHQLIVDGKLPESGGSHFVRAKVRLILGYCIRARFYVMVKLAGESLTRHPVIKRLSQYRDGLRELAKEDAAYERQVQYILKKIKKGEEIRIKGSGPSLTNGKRKREEDGEEEKKKKKKKKKKQNSDSEMKDVGEEEEEAEEEEEEEAAEWEDEGEEGGKRAITYKREKNKGLTPKRKKEQRNPRVKHRERFRKENIRRRGAVREVRTETHRYGGELSGIRIGVKRSVKLK